MFYSNFAIEKFKVIEKRKNGIIFVGEGGKIMKNRTFILILIMIISATTLQAGVKGAGTGAGLGAAVGHIIGGNDEAWIGAALGAAGGAMIESSNKKHEKDIEASNAALHGYNSEKAVAEPKIVEAPIVKEKKVDTWGVRSEEEVKKKMAKERENQEAWKNSF